MEANFKIGDRVKIIAGLKEYIGKKGAIIKDGGCPNIKVGFRRLGEGIKGRKDGQHHWVIMLDDTSETLVLPESNLEKLS